MVVFFLSENFKKFTSGVCVCVGVCLHTYIWISRDKSHLFLDDDVYVNDSHLVILDLLENKTLFRMTNDNNNNEKKIFGFIFSIFSIFFILFSVAILIRSNLFRLSFLFSLHNNVFTMVAAADRSIKNL